jgi:hypothetical protein
VLTRWCARLGPLGTVPTRVVRYVDQGVVPAARVRPARAALLVAVAFGLAVARSQGLLEGGLAWRPLLLYTAVASCSMFAFLLLVGSYLQVLGPGRATSRRGQAAVRAVVVAAASVPVTLALREQIAGLVPPLSGSGSLHLLSMTGGFAILACMLVYLIESRWAP